MSTIFNTLPLHETLNLYVSPAAYIFEPASGLSHPHGHDGSSLINEKDVRESLYVDRKTGRMTLNQSADIPFGRDKVITCYGIIGLLSLATTDFLLIITSRTPSCRLLGEPIYLATDFRLLPLSPLSTTSTILDHPIEKELISLVEQGLRSGRLWFSYGLDLTNSLQRQKSLEEQGKGPGNVPMWQRADDRFFWNKYLLSRMIEATVNGECDLSRFILPVVSGSIELRSATINHRDLLFLLISRRSRHRAGTRYFSRGIDVNGNTSNFNETEQIVLVDPLPENGEPIRRGRVDGRERLSFVQTRGSAPFFWAEINNLRYKPDLMVMDVPETFMSIFRNVWADHGDTVSRAYAGTGALKSDYTRTGQRSREGMIQDGYNSIMRYVRNNFFDGDRQDAFDLLTGAWVAKRGGIPPLSDTRPLVMRSMPYIFAFAITMIIAALSLPRSSDMSIYSFLLLWVFLAFVSGSYIWGNGTSYVSWPRLNPPLEILSYSGPGTRGKVRGRGLTLSSMIPKRRTVSRKDELELGKRKGALID
ncbi:hypothetical protein TREMEDRAFT_73814 [Tremella mesenterica DSM 1558]|uniref:uncharacterized protein n=1 Tax=Tremella mesenterica (strain ATCC 24925 / CBS 8224 / DSM 1558 / NBRC 9311 / NRRL Y-6157 / RJB 2259-6 / UBC 559-6) TaxID=578456 RepID=UPI0003F4A32F|nr:uncharacterized protein TREMEDRAFT_73814 [Tremella mesenterica DSM 1558]EIW69316.1 hypothetical protein TREMEDRAFT_73814 [Tremella mesenterica DSM 1558]